MKKRKSKPSIQPWVWWVVAAVLLDGYPLSFGPVGYLCFNNVLPDSLIYAYLPLLWVIDYIPYPLTELLLWFWNFWLAPNS